MLENISNIINQTNISGIGEKVLQLAGNFQLIVAAAILIIAFFIVIYVLRHVIANIIIGIGTLLFLKFIIGWPIPLTPLVLLISALGGLGGVAAVLIALYMGWL